MPYTSPRRNGFTWWTRRLADGNWSAFEVINGDRWQGEWSGFYEGGQGHSAQGGALGRSDNRAYEGTPGWAIKYLVVIAAFIERINLNNSQPSERSSHDRQAKSSETLKLKALTWP